MNKQTPAKERILLTAHDLFYQDGIRATGVDKLIKKSGVTKVTFYRHYPSKNDLILAFLHYRHQRWMNWFTNALNNRNNQPDALIEALSEWFLEADYRGCAFINTVSELGQDFPEVVEISRQHKKDMILAISKLLPKNNRRQSTADSIAIAIDGAIVRTQFGEPVQETLVAFKQLLNGLISD